MSNQIMSWQNDLEEFKNQLTDIVFIQDRWSGELASPWSYKHLIQDLYSFDIKIFQILSDILTKEQFITTYIPQIDPRIPNIPKDFLFLPFNDYKAKITILWEKSNLEREEWLLLCIKNREELITLFKLIFTAGEFKIKKTTNKLLNEDLSYTKLTFEEYLLGARSDQNKFATVSLFTKSDKNVSQDLFKTFLNAVHVLEKPRVLQLGYNVGYYFYWTWFSGIETTVVDTNQLSLSMLNENIKMYQDLLKQSLISPFNEYNAIPRFTILKDYVPDLKRFEKLELHSYSGILVNLTFSYMVATDILVLVHRLKELLVKNGYIIVNEFDINKETYSEILSLRTTETNDILIENLKKNLGTESTDNSLIRTLEQIFLANGFKTLLRTKHFDIVPYSGWLFKSED